ncbi:hypothetical protein B0J12DRAFT_694157 [Macrophomina phaseolina]|uniref:Uncharacterized protein n=1 Tax=Macrophomina phaseolina TaxID=35725 RepID=A0ABQ8GRY0_9PEZI|nr:hypothetical protein B0J12DRAFT_694157 [Macrophomina phaseolina]
MGEELVDTDHGLGVNINLLNKFVKGGLAQAQSGAQAIADLKAQSAAEVARKQRKADSRKITSSGQSMYASEARRIEEAKMELAVSRARTARNREAKIKAKGQRAKLRNTKARQAASAKVAKRKALIKVRKSRVVVDW